jgi:hypothetical protein
VPALWILPVSMVRSADVHGHGLHRLVRTMIFATFRAELSVAFTDQ